MTLGLAFAASPVPHCPVDPRERPHEVDEDDHASGPSTSSTARLRASTPAFVPKARSTARRLPSPRAVMSEAVRPAPVGPGVHPDPGEVVVERMDAADHHRVAVAVDLLARGMVKSAGHRLVRRTCLAAGGSPGACRRRRRRVPARRSPPTGVVAAAAGLASHGDRAAAAASLAYSIRAVSDSSGAVNTTVVRTTAMVARSRRPPGGCAGPRSSPAPVIRSTHRSRGGGTVSRPTVGEVGQGHVDQDAPTAGQEVAHGPRRGRVVSSDEEDHRPVPEVDRVGPFPEPHRHGVARQPLPRLVARPGGRSSTPSTNTPVPGTRAECLRGRSPVAPRRGT